MPLSDWIHSILGNHHDGYGRPPDVGKNSTGNFGQNNPKTPPMAPEDDDILRQFFPTFEPMMDPFEMHHQLQQQINEMMQSFMAHNGLPGFGTFEGPEVPAITEKQDPRDQYLKPGVRRMPQSDVGENNKSGPITSWLDKFAPKPDQDRGTNQSQVISSFQMFSRTVTLPDGTVKTEEIIRNPDGSEERIESHSKVDGSGNPAVQQFSALVEPNVPGTIWSDIFNYGSKSQRIESPEFEDPKYQCLKPGYENLDPNSKKIDTDLDQIIEKEGIESFIKNLPLVTKEPGPVQPKINSGFESFKRRIVTLPNGVVEREEVVRNADGTEQRTITQTWPDGTSKQLIVPESPFAGQSQNSITDGHYDVLSATLRGVKDFVNILFK
ncbi:uncharacterized protein LOC129001075 isoform X2 [Macrosteles quadrilineatus]|uniref:uncharacterized protein LOC129001075 isoform X2 n=1 Tax=Macrosteles quadrilineatus TaxID=74068 RepID=UPI0023E0910A|nr:uncharacterized protein LOC129001075 isoform X2 [Macrosteles quadrilineatus]